MLPAFDDDGCTFWFDEWFGRSLRHCCDIHDEAFAYGTTLIEFISANLNLAWCGVQSGAPVWAIIALVGVSGPIGFALFFFGKKRGKITCKGIDNDHELQSQHEKCNRHP